MGRETDVKSFSEVKRRKRILTPVRKMRTLKDKFYSYLHFSTG